MAPADDTTPGVDGGGDLTKSNDSHNEWVIQCADTIPTMQHLLWNMPAQGYIIMAVYFLCLLLTLIIYFEEVHFIVKNFKIKARKRATIWILAFFPVFSVCGFLGALVPRSGTLVDTVSNAFFGTCLYQFVGLMTNYMGGPRRMWDIVGHNRQVKTNTPPCCCCCCCLPNATFNRKMYFKCCILVLQMTIIRPILMFFAAVLWTNGSYIPGLMSPYNGYVYIIVLNLGCTLPAMYGLFLIRNSLAPDLEKKFSISGKIASIQLTMLSTAVPNVIIGALVTSGVIECTPIFPSKSKGETIYHGMLVLAMLPFSLIGRKFFHRACDGVDIADFPGENGSEGQVAEVMTIEKDGKKALVTIMKMPQDDTDSMDKEKMAKGQSYPTKPENVNFTTAL